MPIFLFSTNLAKDKIPKDFITSTSALVANILGKPERVCSLWPLCACNVVLTYFNTLICIDFNFVGDFRLRPRPIYAVSIQM